MRYVEAPNPHQHELGDGPSIFLAGGITGCPDWQAEVRQLLTDRPVTVFNPRRATFDVSNPNGAAEQIEWEVAHLRQADVTLFWFPAAGNVVQPIALFELGMALSDRRHCGRQIAVGVESGYAREFDVREQCRWAIPELPVRSTLRDVVADALAVVKEPR